MDKYEMDYSEKTSDKMMNSNSNSMLNRSFTLNRSIEITKEPTYQLYTSPALQRQGSIKNLYNSSFGSMVSAGFSLKGKVKKLCSIFESPQEPPNSSNLQSLSSSLLSPSKSTKSSLPAESKSIADYTPPTADSPFRLPGTEDRVVIYFTSLRGIRRTFQDCHSIRMIFRGFRVNLDERDISMDVAYKKELHKVLGENNVSLPQVFIKGKYIGGSDVVKQLLEAGELARLLKGIPLRALKPCDACNDMRFFPCTSCNGSRKVFDEDEEQLKRCPECNENGLVRCPLCCS
ncbi:Glutaredoxin family protein [Abeliophyllum distichum]|uniref:Glutaredoxin family protein n=1 Tax=Abeliophyllum distichum TaxID=126358 RepID=A0ABD1PEV6_9LAMI